MNTDFSKWLLRIYFPCNLRNSRPKSLIASGILSRFFSRVDFLSSLSRHIMSPLYLTYRHWEWQREILIKSCGERAKNEKQSALGAERRGEERIKWLAETRPLEFVRATNRGHYDAPAIRFNWETGNSLLLFSVAVEMKNKLQWAWWSQTITPGLRLVLSQYPL